MKLTETLYTITGISAFLISATIEYYFFESITQGPDFSFIMIGTFEVAKILSIMITRSIILQNSNAISTPLAVLSWAVKVFLVTLSLISSIGLISSNLDRPHLKKVKENDKARAEMLYTEKLGNLKEQQESILNKSISEIKDRYKIRYEKLAGYYEPKISNEEQLRDLEFNREINGVRRGQHYYEHERKLNEYSTNYKIEKDRLEAAEDKEIKDLIGKTNAKYQEKFEALDSNREVNLNTIERNDYKQDARVANGLVKSFLETLENGLHLKIEYLTFSILFSLLVSFTLEGLIYIIFNNLSIIFSTRKEDVSLAEETKNLKEFLNKNIHDAKGFISKNPDEEGVINGSY